jgi:hypothetical protein
MEELVDEIAVLGKKEARGREPLYVHTLDWFPSGSATGNEFRWRERFWNMRQRQRPGARRKQNLPIAWGGRRVCIGARLEKGARRDNQRNAEE